MVLDDIADDDDDNEADTQKTQKTTGCLPHRSRSTGALDPDRRRHASDPPTASTHQSRLAEKLLKFFRGPPGGSTSSSGSQGSMSGGRRSPRPSGRGSGSGGQPAKRRFMRVVKDENAPPPECIGDNPNIICRYSQVCSETVVDERFMILLQLGDDRYDVTASNDLALNQKLAARLPLNLRCVERVW